MDDTLFPRGRPAAHPTTTYKRRPEEVSNNDSLFSEKSKSSSNEGDFRKGAKRRRNDAKDGPLKEHDQSDVKELLEQREQIKVDFFHAKRAQEGTLLLGCVREIHELELVISLPHCNTGYVKANQISESYTTKIRQHLNGQLEDLTPLSEMFQTGDVVICSVLGQTTSTALQLTLYPSVINKYLSAEDFFVGQMVIGAVKSEEDHGFTISIGKSDITAFLPSKEAAGRTLHVGSVIRAVLTTKRGDGSILMLSLDEKKIAKSSIKQGQKMSLDALQPGTVGFFETDRKFKSGTVGKFLDFDASICAIDRDSEDTGDDDEKVGRKVRTSKKRRKSDTNNNSTETMFDKLAADDQVKVCVLYVNPLTKHVSLSSSPYLLTLDSRKRILERNSSIYPCGHKCEVTLTNWVKGLGALLKLANGASAFCPSKHISDKKFTDISEVFGDKTTFQGRVLQNITLDGLLVVTLKKSIVESEFYSYDKIIPGSKVTCIIQSIQDNGILVTLGENSFSPIKGFIPKVHMADIILRHPEKKFSKGDVIECRVLYVDARGITLTHKRTLLKSKLPVITSYDQLKPELLVHGYITSIKTYGVFINFYNDVHGLVPKSELSVELVDDLEKTYFVGQVMRCRVLNSDPANGKARLSFILNASLSGSAHTSKPAGQGVFGVEVMKKSENGLDVVVCDDEKPRGVWEKGFIPKMHLSDFPSLSNFHFKNATPGMILPNCVTISKEKGSRRLTRKKSIIKYGLDDDENKKGMTFADLKHQLVCPGFIHHTVPYGVFVELPGGLVGLCPKSKMADKFLFTTENYYQEGQSVIAKVAEIDSEKKRFIVTLREADCPELSQEDMMRAYMDEFSETLKLLNLSWPDKFGIGKQIDVEISGRDKDDSKVICTNSALPMTFTAVVSDVNELPMGEKLQATLLYVDTEMNKIAFSRNLKSGKRPKVGKSLKGTVKYRNEDISTVVTDIQEGSVSALSLTRNHPNQSLYEHHIPWKVDDVINFVMAKSVNNNNFVAVGLDKKLPYMPKRERQESESSEIALQGDTSFGNIQVGQMVEGVIKSVRHHELLVRFTESEMEGGYCGNPVTGRLHISEIEDDPKEESFPMKKYQCWDKIKCKVIGFRDVRTQHFLAITKRNSVRCVLDLSVREKPVDLNFDHLSMGQEVVAFSTKYDTQRGELFVEVSPSIKGFIPFLLLSDDPTKSKKSVGKCKRSAVWHCVVNKLQHKTAIFAGKGAMIDRNTKQDVADIKMDCIANGIVTKVFPCNVVVNLPKGGVGKVHVTDLLDDYSEEAMHGLKVGSIVRCAVLSCKNKKSLVLSMRKSDILPEVDMLQIKDKVIADARSLQAGEIVRGFVKNISKFGIFVALSRDLAGRVSLTKASKYYIHDPSIVEGIFAEGRLIMCKVINVSQMEGKVDLSLLEEDTGVPDLVPEKLGLPIRHGEPHEDKKKEVGLLVDKIEGRKRKKRKQERKEKADKEEAVVTKKKKRTRDSDHGDSGLDEDLSLTDSPPGYLKIASQEEMGEEDPGFSWDVTPTQESKSDSDLDSSDEDDDQEEIENVPKKTKKEKDAEKVQEEAELRRKEEMLLEDNLPEAALDWDKLVLASPQNSLLWVSYMAFHLRSTEVEKARAVSERAIKTINFREEKEKWNVWAALLNLENRFGNSESLTKVIERACQHNDPLKVNFHMVSTFERAGKFADAEEICQKMVRKFRQNKTVWMLYITHLMQQGKREEGNEIFKRSLQSLEKKFHLEIISKYAQLEYKSGDPEHGRVLFENALSSFPKRADIWAVYIDMLIRAHKIEEAREVFDRVVTLNLSTKNMRTFFKRYIDFERRFGSDESVAEMKQKALEYIESKTNDMEE